MAKVKTCYVCNNCGYQSAKHLGKCLMCKKFGSMIEEVEQETKTDSSSNRYASMTVQSDEIKDLASVGAEEYFRLKTDIDELDRVLGGGIVDGSVTLLGGDPGIGKSTLLLQVVQRLASGTSNSPPSKVLYISGEESISQIAMRGKRLGRPLDGIRIKGEINLEKILADIEKENPKTVIIDSIQTLFSPQLTSAPGSVGQIKECAMQLNRLAKSQNINLIMICHVTKDGELAGPRALEHIVDTVLHFEGDKNTSYRMLRANKNRFGPVNEVGIFLMSEEGLEEVNDPGGVFAADIQNKPGASIFVTQEGNRSLMIEVQALLNETPLPNPVRRSLGIDNNRLQMLCAVLNKFEEIPIYSCNVFLTLIGGLKFSDTGIDVPAFIAMISSFKGVPVPEKVVSFGEIGLTGDLRQVQNAEDRVKEAARMGMNRVVMPYLNNKKNKNWQSKYNIEICECKDLEAVIQATFRK